MANDIVDYLQKNTGAVLAGAGGLALGTTAGFIVGRATAKKKSKKTKKKAKGKSQSRKRKTRKSSSYARTAGKAKDRSSRRIRQTKTGQPYIILANGRAKFIKKSSARTSRRRKGGRY